MVDTTFSYETEGSQDPSQCRLRIFRQSDRDVVLVTELPDQPGPSITEAAEALATGVIKQYNLQPERMLWIEHYPEAQRPWFGGEMPDGTYDLVEFTWEDGQAQAPNWSPLTREEVEALTGSAMVE